MPEEEQPKVLDWAKAVSQFTRAAAVNELPRTPTPMSKERVAWLCTMVMSELYELACTVAEPNEQGAQREHALAILNESLAKIDTGGDPFSYDPVETCANQADAIVDFAYYGLNVAAAHGMDLDPVFHLVHDANMYKVRSDIIRRNSDGKVLKPPGWTPPDIVSEMKRQIAAIESCDSPSKRVKVEIVSDSAEKRMVIDGSIDSPSKRVKFTE